MVITQLSQLDLNQTYSYADYMTWQFEETVELIKGKITLMVPGPNAKHQDISSNLMRFLTVFFNAKKCRVYTAPFDVRLYNRKKSILANQDIHTVVQPDLCVICNPELIDIRGCNGAPDWIIEILSPGNSKREVSIKYDLYQESGVKEYWLVDPEHEVIHQFVLDENSCYQLKQMVADGYFSPYLFPDLIIDAEEIFDSWLN
jgi:Uma2 family endonuclease